MPRNIKKENFNHSFNIIELISVYTSNSPTFFSFEDFSEIILKAFCDSLWKQSLLGCSTEGSQLRNHNINVHVHCKCSEITSELLSKLLLINSCF